MTQERSHKGQILGPQRPLQEHGPFLSGTDLGPEGFLFKERLSC